MLDDVDSNLRVRLSAPGYAPATFELPPESEVELEATLEARRMVRVRLEVPDSSGALPCALQLTDAQGEALPLAGARTGRELETRETWALHDGYSPTLTVSERAVWIVWLGRTGEALGRSPLRLGADGVTQVTTLH